MRDLRTENRKEAVASALHDVAVITMTASIISLSAGSTIARLFGVEVLHQLHRALDVGEQGSHCLALAVGWRRSIGFRSGDPNAGRAQDDAGGAVLSADNAAPQSPQNLDDGRFFSTASRTNLGECPLGADRVVMLFCQIQFFA